MKRPLQEHISLLEQKVLILSKRSNDIFLSPDERLQASVDLDIAERAIAHFRHASALELKIVNVILN